jgi:pimeloyl-ACP methyl ester carboxylesterase
VLVPTSTSATNVPRAVRAAVGTVGGLLALGAGGAIFLPHAILTGVRPLDVVGILLIPAGLILLVASARTVLRGRRRWIQVVVAVLGAAVIAQWWLVPVINVGLATNAPRPEVPSASALHLAGARDVTFPSVDGVALAGWYVPGPRGTAVILAHGSHGDRADTLAQLRMLHGAGYGVLAFDARGHGESGGPANALGWSGRDDIAGAAAFLRRQVGVGHVAILGLSMGAEEALRAAAGGVPLSAVIADGAGASTLGDQRQIEGGALPASVGWLTMRGIELLSGGDEPPALADVVRRITVPVLLIASGAEHERRIDAIYARQIGPRARLWSVPDAGHTQAIERHPAAYAARVLGFLRAPS